jgi:hypothetical protein
MSAFEGDRNEQFNPYAPPSASLEGPPSKLTPEDARIDAIRRTHLKHEASVQSVGSLHIMFGIILGLGTLGMLTSVLNRPMGSNLRDLVLVLVYGGLTALNLAVGVGLRRLRSWARWTEVALTSLSIVFVFLSAAWTTMTIGHLEHIVLCIIFPILQAYILNLLLSAKGKMIFSPEYQEVIYQTPHIRQGVGCLMRWLLYGIVILIGLGAISTLIRYYFR